MLSFILFFNALVIFSEKIPELSESLLEKKTFQSRLPAKDAGAEFSLKADKKISWYEVLEKKGQIALINILGLGAVFVFSLGLFLDIRILAAKAGKREILKVTGRHLRVRWGLRDIFKLAIIFVFFGYIIQIIEAQLLSSLSGQKSLLQFLPLLNTGIMDLLILGFIVYFVKVKYGQKVAAMGLKIKAAPKLIFLAILSYIAFVPVLTFLLSLLIWLAASFNYQPPQQIIFELFLQEEKLWLLVYSAIMVVVLGPIVEEIFFRGFAYNAVKKKWGRQTAMVLTAAVFAGLHGNLIGFLPIMVLGLLLAYVYEKTGSLIPAITIHILHNGLMITFLFLGRYLFQLAQ